MRRNYISLWIKQAPVSVLTKNFVELQSGSNFLASLVKKITISEAFCLVFLF